jgi:hypothetical protein
MKNALKWLGKNKTFAVLLAIAVYFSIVTFHDEITQLAIKARNAIGRDLYNSYLAYFFLILLVIVTGWFARNIYKSENKLQGTLLVIAITGLMLFSFRFLMVYNIEAIHFVEYMIVAVILMPVFRSYGATVFWVTLLGAVDELFQYIYLVPEFEYFDFNDNVLNLLGAGAGVILVFTMGRDAVEIKRIKWYRSPAIVTAAGLLVIFAGLYLSGKMTIDPTSIQDGPNWFSLNRGVMPEGFWTEAYPGRRFHILRPWEGIALLYLLFAAFFFLDKIREKNRS